MNEWQRLLAARIEEQETLLNAARLTGRNLDETETERFNALQTEITQLHAAINMHNQQQENFRAMQGIPAPLDAPLAPTGGIDSPEYRNAFLNMARGIAPTQAEIPLLQNAAHTDGGYFIPTTLANQILNLMAQNHPILTDVQVMHVRGNFTINVHTGITSGDAAVVPDGGTVPTEENSFVTVSLAGYTYAKRVDIPYAMRAMAIPAFEDYLVSELAQRLGAVVASDMVNQSDSGKIQGILPFVTDEKPENNLTYATSISYADMTALMAAISGVVGTSVIYVNEKTYWMQLANIVDGNKRPLFITDPVTGAVNSTFGVPVKIESAIPDGVVLAGKPRTGYILNYNQDITVVSGENVTHLRTEVVGYLIADGTPTVADAWATLKKA